MATAEQIRSLLRSYSEGDNEHFLSVAMQIAAAAARAGKAKLARELRDLVDEAKRRQAAGEPVGPLPIAKPAGELAGLLCASFPKPRLAEMVLADDTRARLHRVLREYRQQERLREHGLSARRKLLLVGPPGCGKTMTALALAGELQLPALTVQLHTLITKFMGETATKLHLIFEAMSRTRGVYLFDEFDAIGSDRGLRNDVGEIRRVLNSFLQFLEHDNSESIIVAATNSADALDDALFRRFDDVLEYHLPSEDDAVKLVENRLAPFETGNLIWQDIVGASKGLSHAEIARACDDAAKEAVLSGTTHVSDTALVAALRQRGIVKR
jgi:SpoVK/Ycf46/Vps4 family AAA+-type ATPase